MRGTKTVVGAVAAVVVTGAAEARGLIYSQPVHTPGAVGGAGFSTFEGTRNGVFYNRQLADDFLVGSGGWEVNSIRMHGIWVNSAPNTTPQFNIIIMSDANNAPGGKVVTFRATDVTVTTGNTYFNRTEQIFDFALPTFSLAEGRYWLSIQPIVNRDFRWLTSSDASSPLEGNGAFLRDGTGNTPGWPTEQWGPLSLTLGSIPHDLAFSIFGTTIPAPGALTLLGAAALVPARRRRPR